MLSHRFLVVLTTVAVCADTACRRSSDDRMVGIWQFTGMDATMDYVFKADHTFEVWAPPMDVEQSNGPWLKMDFGSWEVHGDELIMEYKRSGFPEFKEFLKSHRVVMPAVVRSKVLRFGVDRIEFQRGNPFIRAAARRGI